MYPLGNIGARLPAMPGPASFNAYSSLATLAFALLLTGFGLRKRGRGRHALLMGLGMALDLALVLVLEFSRDAVGTALGDELNPWQQAHVAASAMAVLLYFPVFTMGWLRLFYTESRPALRLWHIRLGYGALFFRTLGFLFMFSIAGRAG
jgi:hypothetical protein